MRTTRQSIITILVLLATPLAPLAARQERVGAPPEIRELVEAFTAAVVGGSPEAWEKMARERFAPEFLAKLPAPERRKLYDRLSADFKGAKRGPVRRQGPDAPLELQMTGPSGPAGTIVLELTSGMPPKISSVAVEKDSGKKPDPGGPRPPPIAAGMTKPEMAAALESGEDVGGAIMGALAPGR